LVVLPLRRKTKVLTYTYTPLPFCLWHWSCYFSDLRKSDLQRGLVVLALALCASAHYVPRYIQ